MFIYSYQQHDHLLPGNDRMLVIGSSALAKNHGHLKSSRLAADTLIFNFPLNHPRLWRQMEHSLSGARYSIILFMWPPLHLSPANGRLMEKPPEGGGPMESAEDMLCRLFAFLRKQTRRRNLEHRLLQWLRSRPEPFPYPDQDILNIALHGDITPLPPEWNFQFLSWTWDEEKTRLLRGTEFENVPSISCGRSWKLLHMVGPEKPWRLPDAPGTMGQFHWILYSFFWWPEAKKLPAFRKELDAISQGLAPLLRRHIRGQQWKLFFSRGHIFRKRRDKIRWLKKLLSILDGRKP